jgi:hypothetical protein
MDMARPELITSFGQIQLSYATPLVNEPVPDSTESGICWYHPETACSFVVTPVPPVPPGKQNVVRQNEIAEVRPRFYRDADDRAKALRFSEAQRDTVVGRISLFWPPTFWCRVELGLLVLLQRIWRRFAWYQEVEPVVLTTGWFHRFPAQFHSTPAG